MSLSKPHIYEVYVNCICLSVWMSIGPYIYEGCSFIFFLSCFMHHKEKIWKLADESLKSPYPGYCKSLFCKATERCELRHLLFNMRNHKNYCDSQLISHSEIQKSSDVRNHISIPIEIVNNIAWSISLIPRVKFHIVHSFYPRAFIIASKITLLILMYLMHMETMRSSISKLTVYAQTTPG